ncbi:gluconate kinase [Knoellia sinensis KCTC 19936]|uniref:gluconokinase n=1 Tax=Knoellia sinensis KCTC 19936 TaxID=1385520 RepID=A0A0A0JCY1_9MICO|nr:shikimate kinase [Knoellia sinensis]KGN33887.1 gluconate kinase [Knoellia sinensis KCTC 19936]
MDTSDVIVVMGVSGSGKTSVGRAIAAETSWDFIEGEAFFEPADREAYRAGTLDDAGMDNWLKVVGSWIDGYESTGRDAVLCCPALRRRDRDALRKGRPHVRFCHVTANRATLRNRVGAEGAQHLKDDVSALEPLGADEHGVTVSTEGDPYDIARKALASLGLDPGHS